MTRDGFSASTASIINSCAAVLCLANTLKLVPPWANVAPSGKPLPRWRAKVCVAPVLRVADDLLRVVQNRLQVLLVLEALGVDFVDGLGARRTRREPAA